ncbi:NMT1/THI5 like protein [Halomonas chromatireducens]|uniref:NMT1/THI5 like protein n=1 Tax=Halomonas chromatireducens TaxID=507626 RepID=A0A109UNK7_9GAMM|nr:NMT1/THI5 like protein [Halomonas chromatireducens]
MRALKYAVAASLLVTAPMAAAQQLSIATGGTGGVYYPIGGGFAEMINDNIEGASATAEVTGASVENMGLIMRGDADLALALADTVYQAWSGTGDFEGRQIENTRALASVYPNAVQLVTLADSDVQSLSDLVGKRVSVGAPGSGTELNARALLEANGISYDDFRPQRLNFNETADAIRDGDIDAGFWSVGPPTSSILNLAATRDIRLIGFSDEEIENAREAEPVFAAYELRAGMYDGMDEAVAESAQSPVRIAVAMVK